MPILVNGELVEDSVLRAEATAIRPKLFEAMEGEDPRTIEARVKQWSRDNVIERIVLRQAARTQDLGTTAVVPEGESDERAIERLLAKVTENVAHPRNKDITEFYKKNKEEFFTPEMVRAAHIIKNVDETHSDEDARAAIEAVKQQLAEGASFETIANDNSDCPGNGGDLGFFQRGQMVPEFENVVFALEPGHVSEPFRTPFGWHIAKLHSRRPGGIPKLEEVRDQIDEVIYQQKRQKVIEQFLDRLISKADIQNT